MRMKDIQTLLAEAGQYKGAIDGISGPKTTAAIAQILVSVAFGRWSKKRLGIAAAQSILNALGFDAGAVDGYLGHRTRDAFEAFLLSKAGKPTDVNRAPITGSPSAADVPRQRDIREFYGPPGTESNMVLAQLPFKMRIDWNLRQKTSRLRVHKKCALSLVKAITETRDHYGDGRWRQLGLDRYAGGYVARKMRGGSQWSMHAYGCAIDIYARPNGLRMRCPEALFCKPEYKDFLDIMEANNWLPAIRLWGADAMHFQQAKL